MSTELFLYQTPLALTRLIPPLVEKTYEQGKRCVLFVPDEAASQQWNAQLWTYSKLAFLPHANDLQQLPPEQIQEQPIFITQKQVVPNAATIVFNLSAQLVEDIQPFTRVIEFMELITPMGADSVQVARERYTAYAEKAALNGTLWNQKVDGGWTSTPLGRPAQAA